MKLYASIENEKMKKAGKGGEKELLIKLFRGNKQILGIQFSENDIYITDSKLNTVELNYTDKFNQWTKGTS